MYGVDDETKMPIGQKPAAGKKQASFDATNTPQAQASIPGNAKRAAQMQAQAQQPVTGPRGEVPTGLNAPQPSTSIAQGARNVIDVPMGYAEQGVGFVAQGLGQGVDMVRRGANDVFEGTPLAEPNKYGQLGAALSADGKARVNKQTDAANSALQDGALSVLGTTRANAPVANAASPSLIASANAGELPEPAAGTPNPTATAQAGPASDAGPQAPSNGFAPVGLDPKQFGASNDKIVGKVGANGVPEFSNDAADVAGARGQFQAPTGLKPQTQSSQQVAPNGAQALASGTNMPAEPRGLAATGRASNIGNGVGTFSVMGQPGDAAKAIATYDRVNAIRAEINQMRTAGEPRGRHIVKDSSRAPSIADMLNAKLEARQAQTADIQARGLQAQINSDREFARNMVNDQLNKQKTDIDIQSGQLDLDSGLRTEAIRRQLEDPNLPEDQRTMLERSYEDRMTKPADRAKSVLAHNLQRQKTIDSLFKTYSELQPVGADGKTPIPFEQWAQPALQAGGATQAQSTTEAGAPAQPQSKSEYDALPKGARYMKNGQIQIKG